MYFCYSKETKSVKKCKHQIEADAYNRSHIYRFDVLMLAQM